MQRAATFFGSSIGKKVVMAATGLVLFGFVVGHMIGNLQIYLGPEALNDYAEFLQHFLHGQGIWIARGGLLAGGGAPHLGGRDPDPRRTGRPGRSGYRDWQARESTYASRTMVWSGPILAAFIVYHLAHFTARQRPPRVRRRATSTATWWSGFQNPFASAFYILAMLALGLHMYHGVWSMLQTLGPQPPALEPRAPRGVAACSAGASWCSATSRSRWPCSPASSTCRGITMELKANIPSGPDRQEVGEAPLRHEAGQPGQQAQVQRHRGRHAASPAAPAPPRWPSSATTSRSSATRTARAAPTPSPPRAASTRPRTTRTTATASTASSTTPSRAATSAPARRTSTAWPRCR